MAQQTSTVAPICLLATCLSGACNVFGEYRGPSDGGATGSDASSGGVAPSGDAGAPPFTGSPTIAGCPILPANHILNTPIDKLPVHPSSQAFVDSIGSWKLALNAGAPGATSPDEYGIPYNVVHGDALPWAAVSYSSEDADLTWDPRAESDCAVAPAREVVSPCTQASAPSPLLPIPDAPLVEGGIETDPSQPYGDHHVIVLDRDRCRLWELFHVYPRAGGWDVFGSASFDLRSNALRKEGWSSADGAGLPILPLIARIDEANAGSIRHALRATLDASKIRAAYAWPARHVASDKTSTDLPPLGQVFRLKASFVIPEQFSTQAKAVLTALKTYGVYIASEGRKSWRITAEPSRAWLATTLEQISSVSSSELEAVDLATIRDRPGFDVNSGAVPP